MQRTALLPRSLALTILALSALCIVGNPARAATTSYLGWVSNFGDGTVSVIDLVDFEVIATHTVGRKPRGIDGLSGDTLAVVANSASQTISVVHASGGETEIYEVGRKPYDIALEPDAGGAVVTLLAVSQVQAVVAEGAGAPLDVARRPWGIAFDPRGRFVVVACSRGGGIEIIPTGDLPLPRLQRTMIATGSRPIGVAVDPKGKEIAVVDPTDGTVTLVNVQRAEVAQTIDAGKGVWAGAYDPSGRYVAAVTLSRSNEVLVFESGAETRVAVGKRPLGIAFSPDGQMILVANNRSNTVTVIDAATLTVVATIPVGRKPWDVTFSEAEGE